ncbi:hypothetical protein SPRG_16871 [Saprolegnia parasitica CBS 223.65]|uniref:Uncharacterized protein n=1 Tax=Saprolegnia parasitica (strain CBS 223.65) TaxID=695850 RepID=A0A067BTG3_SAPPC|nr:hypothetical protein SPRG_16871 [Saprolegnia parasitica CBS 223.65]KDO17571.1 hypothetical protein SPRG_16871 [Saprolegnia parasitica CBS 223.65]|eukprot:XP_012211720.1 hypothetical protein SPRG_16871 [Saprolegnia parasitica CBS 223.65]
MSSTPAVEYDHVVDTPAPKKFWTTKAIVGAVVFCGVVCASVGAYYVYNGKTHSTAGDIVTQIQQSPGLRVQIHAKRSSMAFNGQTSATVYVVPRAGSGANLKFDAFLSQPGPEVTANYMLLDDRAYWSIVKDNATVATGCLNPDQVPPVQLMQSSLEDSKIECPSGKLLELQFAGENFVFCNSNTNKLTKAVGTDLDMTIEYLSDPTSIPDFDVPQMAGKAPLSCPVVTSTPATTTTSTTTRRLESSHRRTSIFGSSSCGCKGKKKPCLFVHGVGNEKSSAPTSTAKDLWGDIHDHAPCCSRISFMHYESVNRGWNETSVQEEFCAAALQMSPACSETVDNVILVTFSMGNLVASGAFATGKCQLGDDVTWVSIAGPMQGSPAGNLLEDKCAASDSGSDSTLKSILNLVGKCPPTPAYLNLKTQASVDALLQKQFAAAQDVRHRGATKTMCGVKSSGLATTDGVGLAILGSMAFKNGSMHDGVVGFESCSVGIDSFATNAEAGANYKASINHLDASFRNGDGWWGADRKPVKWFECAL